MQLCLSLGSFGVNLDHDTQEIIVIVESKQFNSEIKEIISQYPDDIPIVFSNGKIEIKEWADQGRYHAVEKPLKQNQIDYDPMVSYKNLDGSKLVAISSC